MSTAKLTEHLRIIWAIAAKDMVDAIKNRMTLSVIVGIGMMMLTGQAFPFLLSLSDISQVVVYDAGDSRLVDELREDDGYRLLAAESKEELDEILLSMNADVLGLSVPADFDQVLDSGGTAELDGYVVWAARSAASELKAEMEGYLAELLGQPVSVRVEGNLVYPPAEGGGRIGMIASVLVLVLVCMGGFIIPYLIFEEKQTHTMEALLISPASVGQIIAGKALAGLFYCLTAAAVALAFNHAVIVNWGVALLAVVCGAILIIAIGLVVGSVFQTAQEMSVWIAIPVAALLLPAMVVMVDMRLPAWLDALVPWLPTIALAKVFMLSFSDSATVARALPELAILIGWALPVYALVVWIVRRSDR
jgi:ABC-2 type transport system permease protein